MPRKQIIIGSWESILNKAKDYSLCHLCAPISCLIISEDLEKFIRIFGVFQDQIFDTKQELLLYF